MHSSLFFLPFRGICLVMLPVYLPMSFQILSVVLFTLFIFPVSSVFWLLSIHSIYPVDILIYLYPLVVLKLPPPF